MTYRVDRRSFIRSAALGAAAVAVLPRLSWADDAAAATMSAELGKVTTLDTSKPVFVEAEFRDKDGKVIDSQKLYVRSEKTDDGRKWVVLSAICTHLKCKVKYDGGKEHFVCPCHHSEFDLDGAVLKKPAKKNLPEFSGSVKEEDGKLILTLPLKT